MGSRGGSGGHGNHSNGAFGKDPSLRFKEFRTMQEADDYHKVANFEWNKWDYELNADERKSIIDYTGSAYGAMNKALRSDEKASPAVQKLIDDATSGLGKSGMAENTVVYRGTTVGLTANLFGGSEAQMSNPAFLKSMIGKTVTDKGFMSTSVYSGTKFPGPVAYTIYTRKGTSGMYVSPISNFKGEREFLFNRGTSFIVHQIKTDSNGTVKEVVLEAYNKK